MISKKQLSQFSQLTDASFMLISLGLYTLYNIELLTNPNVIYLLRTVPELKDIFLFSKNGYLVSFDNLDEIVIKEKVFLSDVCPPYVLSSFCYCVTNYHSRKDEAYKHLMLHLYQCFNPDEVIWLKLGNGIFYRATINKYFKLEICPTKGIGTERKVNPDKVNDAKWLINQSMMQDGGLFYIPGKPVDFPMKGYSKGSNDIGVEIDNGTSNSQIDLYDWFEKISKLNLLMLTSAGKSIHGHIILNEVLPINYRNYFSRLLCIALLGDPAVCQEHQPMRVAGGFRKEKNAYQDLFKEGVKHSLDEVKIGLKAFFNEIEFNYPETLSNEMWCDISRILKTKQTTSIKRDQVRERLRKPEIDSRPKIENKTYQIDYSGLMTSSHPPLEYFLSRNNQESLNGVSSNRNVVGMTLLLDLLGCENWLRENSIPYTGDARSLFMDYCNRCASGSGWGSNEWESIWRKNQGKAKFPAITEEGMKKRLSWFYRNNK